MVNSILFFSDPTHPNPLFSFQRSNDRHDQDGEFRFLRTEMHPQKRLVKYTAYYIFVNLFFASGRKNL